MVKFSVYLNRHVFVMKCTTITSLLMYVSCAEDWNEIKSNQIQIGQMNDVVSRMWSKQIYIYLADIKDNQCYDYGMLYENNVYDYAKLRIICFEWLIMLPTPTPLQRSLDGILLWNCQSVIHPFIYQAFKTSHIFGTMYVRIFKFHKCITYVKIASWWTF